MDLIKRDDALKALIDCEDIKGFAYREMEDALKAIPSIDIVRCKECKHYEWADNRAFGMPTKRCDWTGFEDVDDDDFCSRGERSE